MPPGGPAEPGVDPYGSVVATIFVLWCGRRDDSEPRRDDSEPLSLQRCRESAPAGSGLFGLANIVAVLRAQPMIVLSDVEGGSRWFCDVLGLTSGHGGPEYEMLMDGDEMVAQLHDWEADEHPHMGDPEIPSRGNGVLLWFATDAFDEVVNRVRQTGAEILEGPFTNPNAHHREIWLRGPEGYTVVVAG